MSDLVDSLNDFQKRRWDKLMKQIDENQKKRYAHNIEIGKLAKQNDLLMKKMADFWESVKSKY